MIAMRLRRLRPRRTAFRLSPEAALLARMAAVPEAEQQAWPTATGATWRDTAVAEFLTRCAAQYLAAAAVRTTPPGGSPGD